MQNPKKIFEFLWFQAIFRNQFSFYTTKDANELNEIFRIRYQVYCEEYGYLDKRRYPEKLEKDEWDDNAVQFVLRKKENNELAASVRLINNTDHGFPIEKHFKLNFHVPLGEKQKIVEISRLIVSKKYRRKFLLLALIRGMLAYAEHKKLNYVYSVLDDKLYPILFKMGFPFVKIGNPTAYQGVTSPYILNIVEMKENLFSTNRLLYKYLVKGLVEENSGGKTYSLH